MHGIYVTVSRVVLESLGFILFLMGTGDNCGRQRSLFNMFEIIFSIRKRFRQAEETSKTS